MFYKRSKSVISVITLLMILLCCLFIGCANDDLPPLQDADVYKDFSVNYIDVGQGDCIFIRLPDGKNLLIDAGLNDEYLENSRYIMKILNQYSVTNVDYFVLTHPDIDHIGNANDIINNFNVGTAYLPIISNSLLSEFPQYKTTLDLLEQKQIQTITSDYNCVISNENYALAFLSPLPLGVKGSSYTELESSFFPSDRQINDLSPIIYFECFDKRFIFTGDATNSQEKIVLDNYNAGVYDLIYKNSGISIDLSDIDYLKVSHHGADGATSQDFLNLLRPKNFIISVGKENFYGHPRSEVLERILITCPESLLYRTDQVGTITVHKDNEGDMVISTTKQN